MRPGKNKPVKKTRALLPPRARRRIRNALSKRHKPKIVFYCMAGMESSNLGRKEFLKLLKSKKMENRFQVDYEGYMQQSPQHIRAALESADFVVPMLSGVGKKVFELMKNVKNKPIIIDAGFESISDQYERRNYEKVLQKILLERKKSK